MAISAVELKFLQGLIADQSDRSISAAAEKFSEDHYIGTRIGRKFVYTAKDADRARGLLTSMGLPLEPGAGHRDRAWAMERSGISEKSGTIAPHSNSVAFRLFNGGAQVSGFGYQVGTVHEVTGIGADVLMVVENFETFRQLERYGWVVAKMAAKGTVLAIYRGDTIYRVDEAKAVVDASSCITWGFHDFDPAGLHMSLGLRNLEEHLVPDHELLKRQAIAMDRKDLYFNQFAHFQASIEECQHSQIVDLWHMMKKMQRGLPQEWMRDL